MTDLHGRFEEPHADYVFKGDDNAGHRGSSARHLWPGHLCKHDQSDRGQDYACSGRVTEPTIGIGVPHYVSGRYRVQGSQGCLGSQQMHVLGVGYQHGRT